MSKNPYSEIEAELDIISKEQMDEDNPELYLPPSEERDLILIRDLALKAYKSQMDDLMHVEPKNRVRFLEVAHRFLNEAQTAQYRIDYLKTIREKIHIQKKSKGIEPKGSENSGLVNRNELFNKSKVIK